MMTARSVDGRAPVMMAKTTSAKITKGTNTCFGNFSRAKIAVNITVKMVTCSPDTAST